MSSNKKSTIFIENGYCCGHGQIVFRLQNWCIKNNIPYQIKSVRTESRASYDNNESLLSPTKTLEQVLRELGF